MAKRAVAPKPEPDMDDTQGQQPLTSDPTLIGEPLGGQISSDPAKEPPHLVELPDDTGLGDPADKPTGPEMAARHEDEAFERCVHTIENLLGPDTVRRNVVDRLRRRFYGLE